MEADREIRLEEGETKGRYVYRPADKPEAEMTFSTATSSLVIIDHTKVPEVYWGSGIGLKLVTRGVEDARAQGKKKQRSVP